MNENQAASAAAAAVEEARIKSSATWNPSTRAVTAEQQLDRASMIQKTLGTRAAARYMHRNGWSIESALCWLLNAEAR